MGFSFDDRVNTPEGPGTIIGFGSYQGKLTIDVELDRVGESEMFLKHELVLIRSSGRPMISRRRKNPFNATKPPEWETMSKKLRKSWNRKHWRPEQWKCDLALKKEATRQKHRGERAGKGLLTLAEKMARMNPSHDLGEMIDRDPTVRELLKYDNLASAYKRSTPSRRMRILEKLAQVAERGRTIRRANPGRPKRRKARIKRERRKLTWSPDRARIEREETASGYSINPRRRARRK